MSSDLRSVTVKFNRELYEQINRMAEKRGKSLSDTIRQLVMRGLNERIMDENKELIAKIVKAQMKQVMEEYNIAQAPQNREYPEYENIPSLDNTEHPVWKGNLIFERRVSVRRAFNRPERNGGYSRGVFRNKIS